MMPGSVLLSALCHCFALVGLYLGLPHLWSEDPANERVVIVDLVAVKEDRNLPQMARQRTEEVKPPPKSPAEAPPPPPAPPRPAAESQAKELAAPAPLSKSMQPEVKLTKKTEMARLPRGVVPQFEKPVSRSRPTPAIKPEVPTKPDPFASVLKSVEELEETSPSRSGDAPETVVDSAVDPIEEILAEANSEYIETAPLSMTELDNIRYQIQENWNLPAGARDAHNMKVTLHILLGRDGTVLDVTVVNTAQVSSDPFFRAMAESAVRAVLKTEKILYLSPDKYHLWRDMKLNFDPSEMFG